MIAINFGLESYALAIRYFPVWMIACGINFSRLLLIFCVINLLNYVDRGAIASNGVNGSLGTCTESGICTSGSGIQ